MPKSHPPYPPEFRQRIVELVGKGRTPEELARQFEPSAQAIRNWVKQAALDAGARTDIVADGDNLKLIDHGLSFPQIAETTTGTGATTSSGAAPRRPGACSSRTSWPSPTSRTRIGS